MTNDVPEMESIEYLLFKAPLYTKYRITLDQLNGLFGEKSANVDGFCPFCKASSIFGLSTGYHDGVLSWTMTGLDKIFIVDEVDAVCQRNSGHVIRFAIEAKALIIQKFGQLPSFADIAQDESKIYKRELGRDNQAEFHKALGLAAHNVGIGSFVYLRRIFERLIYGRFNEVKSDEGWSDDEFKAKRMEEKIELLKAHLPAILVENRKIYSIMSLGIHELDEESCLSFFPIARDMILLILQDDKAKRDERTLRDSLSKEISAFGQNSTTTKRQKPIEQNATQGTGRSKA